MYSDGSSSRTAGAGNTPSVIGTVTCLPVRSSMMVMVSGMLFPSLTQRDGRGLLPGGGHYNRSPRLDPSDLRTPRPRGGRGSAHLERRVVVTSWREALALVAQHDEGLADHLAGLGRLDDRVEQAALGGDVRVEQPFGVVRFEGGALGGRRPPLEDRCGLPGAHHRQLGR